MLTPKTLGLLATAAIVWFVLPGTANATSQSNITFDAASKTAECAMRDADIDAFILDEI